MGRTFSSDAPVSGDLGNRFKLIGHDWVHHIGRHLERLGQLGGDGGPQVAHVVLFGAVQQAFQNILFHDDPALIHTGQHEGAAWQLVPGTRQESAACRYAGEVLEVLFVQVLTDLLRHLFDCGQAFFQRFSGTHRQGGFEIMDAVIMVEYSHLDGGGPRVDGQDAVTGLGRGRCARGFGLLC